MRNEIALVHSAVPPELTPPCKKFQAQNVEIEPFYWRDASNTQFSASPSCESCGKHNPFPPSEAAVICGL